MTWLTSRKRKKHQCAMNRAIRGMNESIRNDDLWLGRFYARQLVSEWEEYEDGSGGTLHVRLRFFDRKAGITWDTDWDTVNHWRFGATLFWAMNEFIVNKCDVWRNENPYRDEKIDYRKEAY